MDVNSVMPWRTEGKGYEVLPGSTSSKFSKVTALHFQSIYKFFVWFCLGGVGGGRETEIASFH